MRERWKRHESGANDERSGASDERAKGTYGTVKEFTVHASSGEPTWPAESGRGLQPPKGGRLEGESGPRPWDFSNGRV